MAKKQPPALKLQKAIGVLTLIMGILAPVSPPLASAVFETKEDAALRDFQEWRAAIPDYERRLYERVKSLNTRTIRLRQLSLAILVLVLVGAGVNVFLLMSFRKRSFQGPVGGAGDQIPKSAVRDAKLVESLIGRQQEMRNVLLALEMAVVRLEEEMMLPSEERNHREEWFKKIKGAFDQWDDDFTRGKQDPADGSRAN